MQKFECKDCGRNFSSEVKEQVTCPHCGSDNVDYASFHVPYKKLVIVSLFLLIIIIIVKIDFKTDRPSGKSIVEETTHTEVESISNCDEEELESEDLIQEIKELGIDVRPTIKGVERIELDADGNYNVTIKIEHTPKNGYTVIIKDWETGSVVAKSKNGTFKGVPFSRNSGKYYAQIQDTSTEEPLCDPTEITGFVEVKNISKKLSVSELQELINKQDPSLLGHDNEYLSPVYQLMYENLPQDYEAPDNLSDVFEMLNMEVWTSVEVTSLEYDDTKHVSLIKLTVKMPSRPNF